MTLGRMGLWTEALDYYDRALRVRPDYAEVHRNRAYGWLYTGDFERGWPEHEWRLRCRRHVGCEVDRPLWRGEELDGRPILLHSEQGYGDTLQFIRYAALVKERGGLVFVASQTRLLRIVARCPGVDLAFDGTSAVPNCQVHAPLMSLPAIFGTTQSTVPNQVPYLPTEPLVVERWRQALGAAIGSDPLAAGAAAGTATSRGMGRPLLVGVAWQGSPQNPMDRLPVVPAGRAGARRRSPGRPARLRSGGQWHGTDPRAGRPVPDRRAPEQTAARLPRYGGARSACSTWSSRPDTAVAHLAGGLGVPVWLALSTVGEWRWMLDREDSPWYPTMRIFRQTRFGEWDVVFRRMADVLRQGLGTAVGIGGMSDRDGGQVPAVPFRRFRQ